MWQAIENQTGDDHWRLVLGWRRTYELTAAHLQRLTEYRAKLAQAWPPDRNAAAAAYLERLDFLTANMQATLEVAAANYTTFATTVGALATARQTLQPIHDEYVRTAQAVREYEDLVAFNAGSEGATTIGAPPARREDLERLNNRARAIMYDLSHTLTEAQAALKHPPTYAPRTYETAGNPDVYGPNTTVARTGDRVTSSSTANGLGLGSGITNADRRIPLLNHADRPEDVRHGLTPIIPPGVKAPAAIPTPDLPQRGGDVKPKPGPTHGSGGRQRPVPLGGVIGGTIGSQQPPTVRQPPQINPVGGVIGDMPLTQGSNTSMHQQSGRSPLYGMVGSPSPPQKDEENRQSRRRDPDNPWEVVQGGSPIIAPPHEVRNFDPGPTIGLDR